MWRWALVAGLLLLAAPQAARSFAVHQLNPSVLNPDGSIDVRGTLEAAVRWSAVEGPFEAGLPGGLTVAVIPGFAVGLGADTPAEIADYRNAVVAAFQIWETDSITFDIEFDASGLGKEISLGLADSSHPFFACCQPISWAIGFTLSEFDPNRTLTNGTVLPGMSSTHGFVLMNTDFMNTDLSGVSHQQAIFEFQWLLVHEVGHVLGLGHPHLDPNFDDDGDASTPLIINPSDPYAGLSLSADFSPDAAMSNVYLLVALTGALHPDDIAGLDVLYPAPEPGIACDDGSDNDGDGYIDWNGGSLGEPADPGCADALDLSERSLLLACDDGADNDGDGRRDFDPVTFANPGDENTQPAGTGDPACFDPRAVMEDPQCQDGINNDSGQDTQGLIDYDGGQSIWGECTGVPGGCPANVSDPEDDGVANPDPQCVGAPWKNKEAMPSPCGLGTELALLLPPLMWLYRRRSPKL